MSRNREMSLMARMMMMMMMMMMMCSPGENLTLHMDQMKLFPSIAVYAVVGTSLIITLPSQAGTLSQCGSRYNNETTRCYEESNGCFNFQSETLSTGCPKENFWPERLGVRRAREWCLKSGGTWLAPRPSENLGERCSN